MTPDRKFVYTSVAAIAIAFYAANAFGAGAEEQERIDTLGAAERSAVPPGDNLDQNGDGVVTVAEVGDELFYIFDTDGNEMIDNIEWNVDLVHTEIPVQSETFMYIDTDRDGAYEVTDYKVSQYNMTTALTPFDEDGKGLSPQEFVKASFGEIDDNDDKAVTLGEWKDAYLTADDESFD